MGNVPFQSRCPNCGASIPTGAAWCSLCHADLRPAVSVVSPTSSATTVVPGGESGRRSRTATLTAPEAAPEVAHQDAPEPDRTAGRHSRGVAPAPPARPRSGRHAAGGRVAPAARPLPTEPLNLELEGDITPDQVDEIADQMLSHLAASEPRPASIDYDALPGGKWGAIAGGAFALILVVMIVSVVLNLILNH